jgi:hypothetical protein
VGPEDNNVKSFTITGILVEIQTEPNHGSGEKITVFWVVTPCSSEAA